MVSYAPIKHGILWPDHGDAFRVFSSGGLKVTVEGGAVRFDDTVSVLAPQELTLDPNYVHYVHITKGTPPVITWSTAGTFPGGSIPLAIVHTDATTVTSIVDRRALYSRDTLAAGAMSVSVHYVWNPDAAPGAAITVGDQQGPILHSGPVDETAVALFADFEKAAGTSVSVSVQYGNTNSLSTVTSWTTIFSLTVAGKSGSTTGAVVVPADRLLRMNITAISGTAPTDGTITLRTRRPVQ